MGHGKHIIIFFVLLAVSAGSAAQVKVRSTIDRDTIVIGQPISLTVEAYMPLGSRIGWFAADTIPHFLITDRSVIDTAENIDGKKLSQTLTITSFDSGRWQMPPFEILVDSQAYLTDTLSIRVGYTPFDRNADYRDIKDIVETTNPESGNIPWYIALMALVSLAALIYFLKRKKMRPVENKNMEPALSPYAEAMLSLSELRKKPGASENIKLFYTDMNDILRRYILRQFGISTFERTNDELIAQMSRLNMTRDAFTRLARSLRMIDYVKFAKYVPAEQENLDNLETVETTIGILDKKEERAV